MKKTIAIALSILMILSLMPMAFAATIDPALVPAGVALNYRVREILYNDAADYAGSKLTDEQKAALRTVSDAYGGIVDAYLAGEEIDIAYQLTSNSAYRAADDIVCTSDMAAYLNEVAPEIIGDKYYAYLIDMRNLEIFVETKYAVDVLEMKEIYTDEVVDAYVAQIKAGITTFNDLINFYSSGFDLWDIQLDLEVEYQATYGIALELDTNSNLTEEKAEKLQLATARYNDVTNTSDLTETQVAEYTFATLALTDDLVALQEELLTTEPEPEPTLDYKRIDNAIGSLPVDILNLFTKSSAEAATEAYTIAVNVRATATTQAELDSAAAALESAVSDIEFKADFTELNAALASAKEYNESDWTEESFKALSDAIDAAEAFDQDESSVAFQPMVNDAKKALEDAIAGLELKPACEHINAVDDGNCTTAVVCPDCDNTVTPANEKHTGGTATCSTLANCAVCGMPYGEVDPAAHTGEYIITSSNDDQHMSFYTCCPEDAVFDDHEFENGVCICGEEEKHKMIFMNGDEEFLSIDVSIGAVVSFTGMPLPSKDGFEFAGWYTADGVQITNGYVVTGDLVLYAHWEEINTEDPDQPDVPVDPEDPDEPVDPDGVCAHCGSVHENFTDDFFCIIVRIIKALFGWMMK